MISKPLILFLFVVIALAACSGNMASVANKPIEQTEQPSKESSPTKEQTGQPGNGSSSGYSDLLVHLNKSHALPPDYVPPGLVHVTGVSATRDGMTLRDTVLEQLREMFIAAGNEGLELVVLSAYRSYQEQQQIYGREVAQNGEALASTLVARPGHSEHQLGTTVDITSPTIGYTLSQDFQNTPEGKWLGENAHRFGFVMSYPEGKEQVTGYAYEPWHFRYVGIEVATEIKKLKITLEEYLRDRYAN